MHRTISKEVFCYVFAVDGEVPICYKTLFRRYVAPHLAELGISSTEYKNAKTLDYQVAWRLIAVHKITSDELSAAIKKCYGRRRAKTRVSRQSGQGQLF